MLIRKVCFLLFVMLLTACIGSEHDNISDEILYQPTLKLPVGSEIFLYTDSFSLPVYTHSSTDTVSFSDSVDFDLLLGDAEIERDEILSLTLHLNFVNRFPFSCNSKVYFPVSLGASVVIEDYSSLLLDAALVYSGGAIMEETVLTHDVTLTEEQIDCVFESNFMVIAVKWNDVILNSSFWKNLPDYEFVVNVGISMQLNVTSDIS